MTIRQREEVEEHEEWLEKEYQLQMERRKKETTRLVAQIITMEMQKEQGGEDA